MKDWTAPADLRAQALRLWDKGELLAAMVQERALFPLRLALHVPASSECDSRFEAVREWSLGLQAAAKDGFRLVMREWRHPVLGRNELPREAWIDSLDDVLRFIGKQREARRFAAMASATRDSQPLVVPWLAARPLQALELHDAWPRLLAVVGWLRQRPRPGIYLRQVDLPGIDSKFIEQHRAVLAQLLDRALPAEAVDAQASGVAGFARRYGFREKPVRIRLRVLDPALSLLGGTDEDLTLDAASFAGLRVPARRVFITENEVNFLAFPAVQQALVIFGAGYGLQQLGRTPWLNGVQVHYWGDIDTHGFAILDELRQHLPHAESFLMDRPTLLAHEAHWGEESQPSTRDLPHLSGPERALYDELRWQRLARRALRLEQERIGYGWLVEALALLPE